MKEFLQYYKILTIKKIWNLIKIETSRILSVILKRPFVWGSPYLVSLEPGSLCDLRCPECPTGSGIIKRENANLDLLIYQELIDRIKSTTINLQLYFQGEPLLNNDIFRMIKYAKERGLYTVISTNGQRLNFEYAKRITESGLDRIIISVDGMDQLTYEKYRAGGDLGKVLEGAKFISKLKKERKIFQPEIIFQFLVFRHNENQVGSFRKFGKESGADRTWIKTAQVLNPEKSSEIIPIKADYRRYVPDGENKLKIKYGFKNRCARLWRTCVITTDGDVIPCCFDKVAKYKMGSLKEKTLSEIWKNERYIQFRGKVLSGRRGIDICNNCSEGIRVYL
jgi:radical SAM protein with 4Fe4S-binding SPASM domain